MSALGRTERTVIGGVAVFTALAGIAHYGAWASIVAFLFATVALAGLAHVRGLRGVAVVLAGAAGVASALAAGATTRYVSPTGTATSCAARSRPSG